MTKKSNWFNIIDLRLNSVGFDNIVVDETEHYKSITYFKNGTYLYFDIIENGEKIRKIEAGKYFPTDDKIGYETSPIKLIYNSSLKNNFEFLQCSFDGENGEEYELQLNKFDLKNLDSFLQIVIDEGWQEKSSKYNGFDYKTEAIYGNAAYEIILLDFSEQDIPLPLDRTGRKFGAWWADLKFNEKKKDVLSVSVEPFIK